MGTYVFCGVMKKKELLFTVSQNLSSGKLKKLFFI